MLFRSVKQILSVADYVDRLAGSLELFDRFVGECVEVQAGAITAFKAIRKQYKLWCKLRKISAIQVEMFEALLRNVGWSSHKSEGAISFLDIALIDIRALAIQYQYQQSMDAMRANVSMPTLRAPQVAPAVQTAPIELGQAMSQPVVTATPAPRPTSVPVANVRAALSTGIPIPRTSIIGSPAARLFPPSSPMASTAHLYVPGLG